MTIMSEKEEIKKIVEEVFEEPLTENFKKTKKAVKGHHRYFKGFADKPAPISFSLSHFDLDDYYNKADREILKKIPKYKKAIKAMEKAGVNPLPVYNKIHNAVTYNVMKIIKKKRSKYNLKQIAINDQNVLTYVIEAKK